MAKRVSDDLGKPEVRTRVAVFFWKQGKERKEAT